MKKETLRVVLTSQADMMRYYDPERIQGYCRSCDKYGLFWSCPPFDEDPLKKLPAWTHALLVIQKTRIDHVSTQAQLIERFLAVRRTLGDTLDHWAVDGTVPVIAGHCSGCTVCTRSRGIGCSSPGRLRYSLEGLGFDVTALVEGLAGQKMGWPVPGVPGELLIVGTMLCPSPDLATRIVQQSKCCVGL